MKALTFAAMTLGLALAAGAQTGGTPDPDQQPVQDPSTESFWKVQVSGISG